METPSRKRKRQSNDNHENVEDDGNFMDLFTNDDGALSDTEIEHDDMNNEDDSDDNVSEESDIESDEDTNVREVRRKQKFYNIEEIMDPENFHSLPDQQEETFIWKSRDKNDPATYEWKTKVNHQGRNHNAKVIRNRPGPTRAVKQCTSLRELFDL